MKTENNNYRIDYYREVLESINFEDIRETIANRFTETADVDFGNYSYEQANERTLDFGLDMATAVEDAIREFIEVTIIKQHIAHERKLSKYLSNTYPD